MNQFNINQIVAGRVAGQFVILGTRTVGGRFGYQVKEVNPSNHAQVARGEMFFTPDMLRAIK